MNTFPIFKREIFSWVDPGLSIGVSRERERGIFASRDFRKDDILMVMGGHIVNTSMENDLGSFATKYNIDISEEYSFCPLDENDLVKMPQHLVNHSCDPNAGFRDSQFIVAIRDIKEGEEITYDYAFVMWSHAESEHHFILKCTCGAECCRDEITENDWRLHTLHQKYGDYFQPFLKRKYLELSNAQLPQNKND